MACSDHGPWCGSAGHPGYSREPATEAASFSAESGERSLWGAEPLSLGKLPQQWLKRQQDRFYAVSSFQSMVPPSAEVVSSAARAAQVAAEHSSTTAPWQQEDVSASVEFFFPHCPLRPPSMAFAWWWRQPRLRASRRPQNAPEPNLGRVFWALQSQQSMFSIRMPRSCRRCRRKQKS